MQQPETPSPEKVPPVGEIPPSLVLNTAPPVKPGLWSPWATVGLGVAIFAINGLAQSVVALVFAIMRAFDGYSLTSPDDIQRFAQDLLSDGQMLSLAILISAVAGVAATILFVKIRHGFSVSEYLGFKTISLKTLLALFGIYLAMLGLALGVGLLMKTSSQGDIFSEAYYNTPWPVVFWLAIVVFGPVYEEMLFRGFLFVGLRQSALGITGTIIVTGFVFALLHAAQYGVAAIAEIFVLGIIFGIVRWRTGSLWSSIFLHGLWNLGQMFLIAFFPTLGT